MKHLVIVSVEHRDPLPVRGELSLTDVLADRAFGWLHANGVQCEVTAELIVDVEQPCGTD